LNIGIKVPVEKERLTMLDRISEILFRTQSRMGIGMLLGPDAFPLLGDLIT